MNDAADAESKVYCNEIMPPLHQMTFVSDENPLLAKYYLHCQTLGLSMRAHTKTTEHGPCVYQTGYTQEKAPMPMGITQPRSWSLGHHL